MSLHSKGSVRRHCHDEGSVPLDKVPIDHAASVAIIYERQNPANIYIDVKDDGHPKPLVRRKLCPPGGNWLPYLSDEDAGVDDKSPLDTLVRELREELTLTNTIENPVRLADLPRVPMGNYVVPSEPEVDTLGDRDAVGDILKFGKAMDDIIASLEPWGSYLHTLHSQLGGSVALVNYWVAGLSDETWSVLSDLQSKYGNLSNESISIVTSLEEIVASRVGMSFGHGPAIQGFFLGMGFNQAHDIALNTGFPAYYVGPPPKSYEEIVKRYDVRGAPA